MISSFVDCEKTIRECMYGALYGRMSHFGYFPSNVMRKNLRLKYDGLMAAGEL